MEQLYWLFVPLGLLLLGFFVGRLLEARHFASIAAREQETASLPTTTFPPTGWTTHEARLVTGSVVVSLDYFKRFLAFFRGLVGGTMRSYTPLLERGRREAILRMKAAALAGGSDAVINVRLETARLASAKGDGKGTSGVEIVAYGTGVKRLDPHGTG